MFIAHDSVSVIVRKVGLIKCYSGSNTFPLIHPLFFSELIHTLSNYLPLLPPPYSLMHTCTLTHLLTHPLTNPPTHSLTHPPTHSSTLTHPPTHPLTHSHFLTHSPTHSFTLSHPLTHSHFLTHSTHSHLDRWHDSCAVCL